jgi:predicted nuclease of predicted toxin-antitoxin system
MNVLLDTCVWGGAKAVLEQAGHDVIWCGDWAKDPGDQEILAYALREQRVLITQDKDFGELAIVRGHPHAGIVRLVGFAGKEQGDVCARILGAYHTDLCAAAIVTVTKQRVRVRPA